MFHICTDVDECLLNRGNCSSNGMCQNAVGSHTCTCFNGYTGNGFICQGNALAYN